MNSTETKTELPWIIEGNHLIDNSGRNTIAVFAKGWSDDEANMKYVKDACNNYANLRTRLEAIEKELASIKIRNLANAIKQICDECGHTTTEDGCAFCIKKSNGELVELVQRAMLNTRNDAILLGRLGLGDPEHVKETQWWKDAEKATAEALKGEG